MDKNGNVMKHFVVLILAFAAMTFAEGFRNGTGFFVNSEYIVTAYHVVEDYDHNCYYDIQNDSCYKVHIVDYDAETDIVLLKLDEVRILDVFRKLTTGHCHIEIVTFKVETQYRAVRILHHLGTSFGSSFNHRDSR